MQRSACLINDHASPLTELSTPSPHYPKHTPHNSTHPLPTPRHPYICAHPTPTTTTPYLLQFSSSRHHIPDIAPHTSPLHPCAFLSSLATSHLASPASLPSAQRKCSSSTHDAGHASAETGLALPCTAAISEGVKGLTKEGCGCDE
jgi:hypothetical protein